MYIEQRKQKSELSRLSYKSQNKLLLLGYETKHFGSCGSIFLIIGPEKGQLKLGYTIISRARKIVTKFHNYSYEIVMSPVIVNSYKNGHNSYQIVK